MHTYTDTLRHTYTIPYIIYTLIHKPCVCTFIRIHTYIGRIPYVNIHVQYVVNQ